MSDSVAVTIPTRNAAATIGACLESIERDGYPVEIVVADAGSADGTIEICLEHGARVLEARERLLEARFQAFEATISPLVLMLDADHIVKPGAIQRCASALDEADAVILEERSASPTTFVGKLFEADRRVVHRLREHHAHPKQGTLLARGFRRTILRQAFDRIPEDVRRIALAQDHAVLNYTVGSLTRRIDFVPDALLHRETESLSALIRKNYRWGEGDACLFDVAPELRSLATAKVRGRLHRGDARLPDFARSLLLLGIKAVPYSMGYVKGAAEARLGGRRQRSEQRDTYGPSA